MPFWSTTHVLRGLSCVPSSLAFNRFGDCSATRTLCHASLAFGGAHADSPARCVSASDRTSASPSRGLAAAPWCRARPGATGHALGSPLSPQRALTLTRRTTLARCTLALDTRHASHAVGSCRCVAAAVVRWLLVCCSAARPAPRLAGAARVSIANRNYARRLAPGGT